MTLFKYGTPFTPFIPSRRSPINTEAKMRKHVKRRSAKTSRGRKRGTLKEALGLSDADVQELARNVQALEAPMSALKAQVDRMMARLTPREREVLEQRFGIKL